MPRSQGSKRASRPDPLNSGNIEILPPESTRRKSNTGKKDSKDLVPYDSLQAYLSEISEYPILSREEERELAIRYRMSGDLEAAYKLVLGNLRLVVSIAREYEKAARSLLDLIQEGNIGLMEAVKNFDPYRNVRFPTYAVWWIKAYIIRYVIANWRMVKIGTTQAQRKLFFNLQKEKDRLKKLGFTPGPKLIAQNLNVKESEVIEMEQRLSGADVSVDAPLGVENPDSSLLEVLPAETPNAEELYSRDQLRRFIASSFDEFAAELNEKELAIFKKRLLKEKRATLEDLANEYSLSKERIRQIENRVKEKLKEFMLSKVDDPGGLADLDL